MIFFLFASLLYFVISVVRSKFLINILSPNATIFEFNPISIYFWIKLPIDLFKILFGPLFLIENKEDYKYVAIAIAFSCLSDALELFLMFLIKPLAKKIKVEFSNFKIFHINFKPLGYFFFLLFLLSFYILASTKFGFFNWILNPREGYQLYRSGAGQYWVLSVNFLAISFAFIMIGKMSLTRRIVFFVFYAICSFILGSKGLMIEYLIFFLIILWFYKEKHLKTFLFYGTTITVIGLLFNFFKDLNNFDYNSIFEYFTYYTNSGMYYREFYNNNITLFNGQIFLSNIWSLVPRSLYPDKPYVYGQILINEYFFPGAAELTNTPAFGGPITYFADFGILGIFLFTLLNPIFIIKNFFFVKLLFRFDDINKNVSYLLLFVIFFSPYFLIFIDFPLNIFFILLISVVVLLYILFQKKVKFNENRI